MKTKIQTGQSSASVADPCHRLRPIPLDAAAQQATAALAQEIAENIAQQSGDSNGIPCFLTTFKAIAEKDEVAAKDPRRAWAVIGFFLQRFPDAMFSQLRARGLAAFQPKAGPVLVLSGDGVREVFANHQAFTVDFYGAEMQYVLSSPPPDNSSRVYHFILGTDDDCDYLDDRAILETAVNAYDPKHLRDHLAAFCHAQVARAVNRERYPRPSLGERPRGDEQAMCLDVVTELARAVPMFLVKKYMGLDLPSEPQYFQLSDGMHKLYGEDIKASEPITDREIVLSGTGLRLDDGVRPDDDLMYCWIKTGYEAFFNNLHRNINVRREGFRNSRLLLCFIQHELVERKRRLQEGATVAPLGSDPQPGQVPDGLLTRLLLRHLEAPTDAKRHTELRISENVLGVVLGIMVGLEEAIARVVEALLYLDEGKRYQPSSDPAMAASFGDAVLRARAALSPDATEEQKAAARQRLTLYFQEGLRLEPQAEALIRVCVQERDRVFDQPRGTPQPEVAEYAGNKPVAKGTMVLVAHRSAMRDIEAPNEFRLGRQHPDQPQPQPPAQDMVYLFQGFGRHKCLGQYMAPAAAVEVLIALLALDDLKGAGKLKMDKKGLYAVKFPVTFTDGPSTQAIYPTPAR